MTFSRGLIAGQPLRLPCALGSFLVVSKAPGVQQVQVKGSGERQ